MLVVYENFVNLQPFPIRDQPTVPKIVIPTILPSETLRFRPFGLVLACVGIAGVGIAVCTLSIHAIHFKTIVRQFQDIF
jgi:hypothetical protein